MASDTCANNLSAFKLLVDGQYIICNAAGCKDLVILGDLSQIKLEVITSILYH